MSSYLFGGTTGDVFSSLATVRCLGPGDYYLRFFYIDEVCRRIGWSAGRHAGRMNQKDFDFLAPLMEIQSCITKFAPWNGEEVVHDFEKTLKWRDGMYWPQNFANKNSLMMGVDLEKHFRTLQIDPYVEVDKPTVIPGKPICISRNPYYHEGVQDITQVPEWLNWIERRLVDQSFFVGLPEDHAWFEDTMKVKVQYVPTPDALSLARLIAGSKMMIANQSMPGTLAVALGATVWIETRKNVELDQNEILYPYRANVTYF